MCYMCDTKHTSYDENNCITYDTWLKRYVLNVEAVDYDGEIVKHTVVVNYCPNCGEHLK